MGINFPISPNAGDKFTPAGAGMPTYTYDGEKWTTIGGAIGTGGAPLDSPALIGNPTAPTPPDGDNDTSLATTAFVTRAVSEAMALIPAIMTYQEYRANTAPSKLITGNALWPAMQAVQLLDTGGVITPDFTLGFDFFCSLTASGRTLANPVFTAGAVKQGQKGFILLLGGSVTSYGSAYKFPNGIKPTSSGGWDLIAYDVWDTAWLLCTPAFGLS